jgi:hypothetical protein
MNGQALNGPAANFVMQNTYSSISWTQIMRLFVNSMREGLSLAAEQNHHEATAPEARGELFEGGNDGVTGGRRFRIKSCPPFSTNQNTDLSLVPPRRL